MFLLCCGGFLAAWRYRSNEFHDRMANNAVVKEHLGELETCEMSWGEESTDKVGDGAILLELRGSKGASTMGDRLHW